MRTLALALLLALAAPVGAAEHAYDPIATRLPLERQWIAEEGVMDVWHATVWVPGAGTFDVDAQLPENLRCPPKEVLKRKLPGTHDLIAIEATIASLGWHPIDGFNKLRITSWGTEARMLHIAVYVCR